MKITKLRLQSFRNHTDSTLDLSGTSFCVIRGANASGKSSIAQAISVNLTNTTMGLPTDGKGYQSKVKDGSGKAIVTAEIHGQHCLENVVTMSLNTSGRTVNVECLDDPDNNKIVNGFKGFLADRKTALLIASNTDFYPRLDEKSQGNLIAKLVLPSHYDFPKDKVEETNRFLDTPINFDAEPFEVITQAYKGTYKQREITNRQVKEFSIPDALPIPKGVDSASLQSELTSIREQRAKLQAERDAAVAEASKTEIKRATLQTKIEGLREELDKGKKRLSEIESRILSDEQVKHLTEIAAKKDELENLKKQHSAWRDVMSRLDEQVDKLNGLLGVDDGEKEVDVKSVCPMCEQDIDAAKIGDMVSGLKKEIADADQELQELDTKIEAIGDISAAKESLRKHESNVKEKSELEASLTDTVTAGKAARAELDALGQPSDATLPFNDPLAQLQAQEDKVVEQLRPVMAAEERAKEITWLTEQKARLEKKAATLDTLVDYFGKDGVKKTLISEFIGSFENKINSVLDQWGYKASLSLDPFVFNIVTARGYSGPVKELSGAEEYLFKVAFQCAVSVAAGINFVVLDEVEALGESIRKPLYEKIFELIQEGVLEQAILIGYSLDKTLPDPQAPGSAYFFVEDGSVTRLT